MAHHRRARPAELKRAEDCRRAAIGVHDRRRWRRTAQRLRRRWHATLALAKLSRPHVFKPVRQLSCAGV
eukprot:11509793-Karenia_brevis.AAC.1